VDVEEQISGCGPRADDLGHLRVGGSVCRCAGARDDGVPEGHPHRPGIDDGDGDVDRLAGQTRGVTRSRQTLREVCGDDPGRPLGGEPFVDGAERLRRRPRRREGLRASEQTHQLVVVEVEALGVLVFVGEDVQGHHGDAEVLQELRREIGRGVGDERDRHVSP